MATSVTITMVLLAVIVGALASTGTQIYLEGRRTRRDIERAKALVAGELFHAQIVLRDVSRGNYWPPVDDVNSFLTSSAWRDSRSHLVGAVPPDVWDQLVMTYARLELDRSRFATASKLPVLTPLPPAEATALKETANHLGRLRRQLGSGDPGWLDNSTEATDRPPPPLTSSLSTH